MKLIELREAYEPLLPPRGKGMDRVTKDLLMKERSVAAKHGFTIDGGMDIGASGQLPVTRKDHILFGGALIPKGGVKGEEKQTTPFEKRAEAYVHELYNTLLKPLLVRSLNDQLETDYEVVIQTKPLETLRRANGQLQNGDPYWTQVEKTTPEKVVSALRFGKERRGLPYCLLTWAILRNKPDTK